MSDYIYNNFSFEDDKETKEPVNIYFEVERNNKPKKPNRKRTFIAVCCVCFILCAIVATGGTYLANYLYGVNHTSSQSMQVLENTIYISNEITPVPTSAGENAAYNTIADVAAAVCNSVVEIKTEYVQSSGWYQYIQSGAGSGVIIGKYSADEETEKGYYVITNAHVIQNDDTLAETITVTLRDQTTYSAKIKGYDSDYDIAVLTITTDEELQCATWVNNSDSIVVGEEVVVIGNPLGSLGGSVTSGIISATSRKITIDGNKMNLIQINASINPGNSGGGLFNMNGELIGIVNARAQSSSTTIDGIGFAIPANDAIKAANDIMNYGYVKGKSDIGVVYSDTGSYRYGSNRSYETFYGNLVQRFTNDINAEALEISDLIVAVNGTSIDSSTNSSLLSQTIKDAEIGDTIELEIIRVKDDRSGYDRMTVTISVMEYEP